MDYVLIFVSAFIVAVQFSITKVYQQRFLKGSLEIFLQPIVASLAALGFAFAINGFRVSFLPYSFYMAGLNAATIFIMQILALLIVKYGRVSTFTLFCMLGNTILPFLFGTIFLSESISVFQIIGLIVLTGALILPVLDKSGAKKGSKKLLNLLCILIFFVNGAVPITAKLHQISPNALNATEFMFWGYIWLFLFGSIGFICVLIMQKTKTVNSADPCTDSNFCVPIQSSGKKLMQNVKPFAKPSLLLVVLGIITATGFLLQLIAAKTLPASVMYPIITGGVIILTSLGGKLFFGEKINKLVAASLILTLLGTILFLF